MKILWFEVSVPARYHESNRVVTGWQDSLEEVVRNTMNVELIIAFESTQYNEIKHIDGITYIPIYTEYTRLEKYSTDFWGIVAKKIIPRSIDIVKEYNPDIIHVFGTEWPFGLIAEHTQIPVVVHIQGSMIPYNNALFPPGYSNMTMYSALKYNFRGMIFHYLETQKTYSREKIERRIWKSVKYYMGRTDWDYALANIMHPNCSYF